MTGAEINTLLLASFGCVVSALLGLILKTVHDMTTQVRELSKAVANVKLDHGSQLARIDERLDQYDRRDYRPQSQGKRRANRS